MKVAYVNTLFFPNEIGGAEKSLRNLISALQQHHAVSPVVITLNPKSASVDETEDIDGVKVFRLGYRNHRFIFDPGGSKLGRARWHLTDYDNHAFDGAIGDILRVERPDLVHTNNLLGFSARPIHLARARGLPVVHTIRDYYLECWKSGKFSHGRNCETQCAACVVVSHRRKQYSREVSCVVGNSAFILDDHLRAGVFRGVPTQRVVYNIYEPEAAVTAPRSGPGAGPIRLGYMGRLNREKGICELVDLVKGVEGFELVVAGDGDQAAHVQAAAAACANIRHLGYASPKTLTDAIDVLVVPSLWNEPLSRTIFEAYSHGVPVIGSTCGGTPEIVEPGVTGALFEPQRFADIFVRAREICASRAGYEAMSRRCLDYARRFSRQEISTAYHDLYREVLAGSA